MNIFSIEKKFDFNKYNLEYSWIDKDYILYYTKKSETGNLVYLVCSKREVLTTKIIMEKLNLAGKRKVYIYINVIIQII